MVRILRQLFVLAALLLAPCVLAVEPADSTIKAVMDDLARYEQQLAGSPSPSTVNRTIKLLELTRQRLESSSNKTHASWAEAAKRYNALLERLRAPASAPATAQPAPAKPAGTPAPAQPASPARQLISQDVARLNKLSRDIDGATRTLDQGGVKPFQDPAYVQKYQQAAERYRQQLNAYAEFADRPEVQAATAALDRLDALLAVGIAHNAKSSQELGDVQSRLAALYQRVNASTPPPAPDPLSDAALTAWLAHLDEIRQQSAADQQELLMIKANAHLPLTRGTVEQGAEFDMQNVESMLSVLDRNLRKLDSSVEQLTATLDAQMKRTAETLDFYEQLDPANPQAQKNMFLGAGQLERGLAALDAEIERIKAAVALDQRLQRPSKDARERLLALAQNIRAGHIQKRQQALALVRMPAEASDDDALLEIAEAVLETPKYGVGPIERLLINVDRSHHQRESSEVEFDDVDISLSGDVTLTGTETTTRYEWQEFQVATAERVGDAHFIFYNTLRYFTAGAATTPLNRWVLSARFQSTEILEENLHR